MNKKTIEAFRNLRKTIPQNETTFIQSQNYQFGWEFGLVGWESLISVVAWGEAVVVVLVVSRGGEAYV